MSPKKLEERKQRIKNLLAVLKKLYPNPSMALNYETPWQLVVAVVLSAQCTDKRVNEVTKNLFKKYPSLEDYLKVDVKTFEQDIKPTGFFKNKAKNILAAAKILHEEFDGQIPRTIEQMTRLPGVGRKTANVVLGALYGISEGIAVDTHVRRFANRFDLTDSKDPKQIEKDLMKIAPKKEWPYLTYRFIDYGRDYCPARKHDCAQHPLTQVWPAAADRWIKAN